MFRDKAKDGTTRITGAIPTTGGSGEVTEAELTAAIAAHASASDPHPTYTSAAELAAAITAHEAAGDPHPGYVTTAEMNSSIDQVFEHDRELLPTGVLRSNIPIYLAINANSMLSSGRLVLVRIPVKAGETYDGISFFTAAAGAGTPTHQVFALYNSALDKVAVTNDDLTTAWAANSRKRLAFATPYSPPADDYAYAGIMLTYSTAPTLLGIASPLAINGLAPELSWYGPSGLTTPESLPASLVGTFVTQLAGFPLVMLD